jgi:mono/diheme cytochrome c family protein
MKPVPALTLAAALLMALAAGAGALVVYTGAYNVGATTQHWQPVYSLLETTLRHSLRLRWRPREIYWITRHGIKMSGMPAWALRLDDGQLWDVVAFVQHLPRLTPQAYAQLAQNPAPAWPAMAAKSPGRTAGAGRGRQALYQYACSSCHTIPGITGSSPNVGRRSRDWPAAAWWPAGQHARQPGAVAAPPAGRQAADGHARPGRERGRRAGHGRVPGNPALTHCSNFRLYEPLLEI